MSKGKKKFSIKKRAVLTAVGSVLSVALIVAIPIAYQYEGLLDTVFGVSGYTASEDEKDTCRELVAEGAVLLKNEDNALPLGSGEKKLALFGQNSVDFVYGGSGSGGVDANSLPTLKDALESREHGGFTVDSNLWSFYSTGAGASYRKSYPNESGVGSFEVNEVPISVLTGNATAVSTLGSDDVAIVTVGRSGGESSDLPTYVFENGYRYLQIDGDERATIKYACSKFSKVILIVNANNAVELGFLEDEEYSNVKAAIWVGGVGQEGLYGLADILCGNANPSGRLVDTYAYDSTSAPSFNNFGDYTIANADEGTSRANKYLVYGEGIYIGYRYYETRYEDAVLNRGNAGNYDYSKTVQYPFGYGLSYTTFDYSEFTVEPSADGESYTVSVTVTNSGSVAGKETVEVYLQKPYTGIVETSAIELAGFAKTKELAAGESETVTVTVDKESFTSYDYKTNKTYILDSGDYYLAVGSDAHNALNNVLAANGVDSSALEGDSSAELAAVALTQTSLDSETYSVSSTTGEKITNQFDDTDINYYDDSFTYLSRSDWTGTLASSANYKNGNWTAPDELISDLKFYRADEVTNDSSLPATTVSSTATSYTVQDMIGVDYSDSKWDDLVNQLSWSDISKLVRIGGYSTIAIDSIGLPSTTDKDGPSGFSATLVGGVSTMSWPAEVVMASTWNQDLVETMGEKLGDSSIAAGVTGWYAPGINIHRSPYSGRNFEYFSEDGVLSGLIGAAEMRGVRSRGVIAYAKHFALNDQETNRYGGAIFSNEQGIREISLKGFEYMVKEGKTNALMVSMNRFGARWAGAHKGLMTNVLRGEWGFEGMTITDQASVTAMYYEDMIAGLWAGTDMWLNSNNKLWPLAAYDETTGGLEQSSVSYKENATVTYYLHRAAKNIIYAVTNSNAVQSYSESVQNTSAVFPWRIMLWIIGGAVWTATLVCGAFLVIGIVKAKRGGAIEPVDSSGESDEQVSSAEENNSDEK